MRSEHEILRNIASLALDAAEAERGCDRRLVQAGYASAGIVAAAESRCHMLAAILGREQSNKPQQTPQGSDLEKP